MVFIPVEEVQHSLVVPWVEAEKAAKDFFREEWVEEPELIMLLEDLEEEVVRTEVVEATLEEAAGMMKMTPVGEGEDLTMQEKTNRTNVATTQLDMVR